VPVAECIFQGAIENVNASVEEGLNSVPVPPHLLLLDHSFGNDLVDRGLCESGWDRLAQSIAELERLTDSSATTFEHMRACWPQIRTLHVF
jgi:hypothetical protein